MKKPPPQPPESDWHFVEELQSPLWTNHHWAPREPRENEADLRRGVSLISHFSDEARVLETAFDDFHNFLRAGDISENGDYRIAIQQHETGVYESYKIEIEREECRVLAGDSEGVRRAIFHLEDAMRRAAGPFLEVGTIERAPQVKTRISRCFFGPINRPPKNRDELADDINYYPDEYLNRLAHDGVNGLWLTVQFRDVVPSRFFPTHGLDSARRLQKLREMTARCARYGIRIFLFCIEPRAFGHVEEYMNSRDVLDAHPELAGHYEAGLDMSYFCTLSEKGQQYIEESFFFLFSEVPDLGGLIGIHFGERPTHCYSSSLDPASINCPRCSKKSAAEVFAHTLGCMNNAMKKAAPRAELISWLYAPDVYFYGKEAGDKIAQNMSAVCAAAPPGVTMQVNFESGGMMEQEGEIHRVRDYSLAYVGPSQLFADCARALSRRQSLSTQGGGISAKLQVGCSHEVATVPFVPAPGNLYRKYAQMHELGVSAAMHCWFFGCYPSPMTKAAGELSFAPFPQNEDDFLLQLAQLHWGDDAPTVVAAWKEFRDSYAQFPAALQYAWFGPLHDCIVWPLHLFPSDTPIQPSWLLNDEESGDRIGEVFAPEYSQTQMLRIARAMVTTWREGVHLLEEIAPRYENRADLMQEIGVARALGLQMQSALNVLRFYQCRDDLPFAAADEQRDLLDEMERVIRDEIENARVLSGLCEADSRLGFHGEAEGYKYFPAKLEWRIHQLEELLRDGFPRLRKSIGNGEPVFAEHFGLNPQGAQYTARAISENADDGETNWESLPPANCEYSSPQMKGAKWRTSWQAQSDDETLHLRVNCAAPQEKGDAEYSAAGDLLILDIEPRRGWPIHTFRIHRDGAHNYECHASTTSPPDFSVQCHTSENEDNWFADIRISLRDITDSTPPGRPMRLNIERQVAGRGGTMWIEKHPFPQYRLLFGTFNPQNLGWLLFA